MKMENKFKLPSKFNKNNNALPKRLASLGWYYKDDTAQGWSYHADMSMDKGIWSLMKKLDEVAQDYYKQPEIQEWLKEDRQDWIDAHYVALHENIEKWRATQPKENVSADGRPWLAQLDSQNSECVGSFTLCVLNIVALTNAGALQQDNYNGTTYAYIG